MNLSAVLSHALTLGASDIHCVTGQAVRYRLHGELHSFEDSMITDDCLNQWINLYLTSPQKQHLQQSKQIDFALALPDLGRFRAHFFQQQQGWSAAFRIIPGHVPCLNDLHLPSVVQKISQYERGLVLVTGATGSGKTTTLAAMIHEINSQRAKHIITLEDPIEFIHTPVKSLVQQRELGQHMIDFESGLRGALREDPDVIMVGELRDLTTIRLALTAAETGHLVLATLHTMSAAKTIHRIIDVFPAEEKATIRAMLADSLQAVIAQELVIKKGGGRVAIQEIMVCNAAIRNLIREDRIPQLNSVIQTGAKEGMQTTEMHRAELISHGIIS